MNRKRPLHLCLIPVSASTPARRWWFMATDPQEARREATHWHVRLREEEGDAEVTAAFARWLEASPLHRTAWKSMCGTMGAMAQAPAEWWTAIPSGQTGGQRRSPVAARTPVKRGRAGWIAAAAAACIFALLLPTIGLRLQADFVTRAGTVEQVRLADGSIVQIGPDSAIAVEYGDAGRTVRLLSGQALFDVRHDPAHPFRVKAGDVTTTVLGTRFDVRMLGGTTSIAVAQGHVQVADAAGGATATHDLLAGDWVRIGSDHAAETGNLMPDLVGGWQKGEALAENRTIGSVIDEIRPWFAGRIFVSDPALAARRVTGIYDVKDPERALDMIVRPYGGRITHVTPWILIVGST
jgi:transmembrane sensor